MSNPKTSVISNFQFVGERDYIQGSAILDFFIGCVKNNPEFAPMPEFILSFTLRKEMTENNGYWKPQQLIDADDKNNIIAILNYTDISGNKHKMAFVSIDRPLNKTPQKDPPSVINHIQNSDDFQGESQLIPSIYFSDFFRGLIASNKKLHQETLLRQNKRADQIRLIFIENMPIFGIFEKIEKSVEMKFIHLKHFSSQDRTYTLNKVFLSYGTNTSEFTVCYSY